MGIRNAEIKKMIDEGRGKMDDGRRKKVRRCEVKRKEQVKGERKKVKWLIKLTG